MTVQNLSKASPLKIFLFSRRLERGPLPPFPELNLLLPGSKNAKRCAKFSVPEGPSCNLRCAGGSSGNLAETESAWKAENSTAKLHELRLRNSIRQMDLVERNEGGCWNRFCAELVGFAGSCAGNSVRNSESSTELLDRGKERRFLRAAAVRFLENALGIEAALRFGLGRAKVLPRKFSGSAASARIQKISASSKNAAEAERTEPWSATRVRACLQALQGSDNARARPPHGPKRPPKGWKRGGNAQKFCHPKSAHGFHSEF